MRANLIRAFLAFALIITSCLSYGHDLTISGIKIEFFGKRVRVTVTTPISRLIRSERRQTGVLAPIEADLAIRKRLHLDLDGKQFVPLTASVVADERNDMITWESTSESLGRTYRIYDRLYPEDSASRTAVSVVRDARLVEQYLLDSNHRGGPSGQPSGGVLTMLKDYLGLGIFHILSGWDHLLFIAGLLLLGGSTKTLFRIVTSFTIAHTITLGLAATGNFSPSLRIIEPLIALSIVAVAVENLRPRQALFSSGDVSKPRHDMRPWIAFGFGLIHGFGFAGALSEVGLPSTGLLWALGGFNLGVELGQLAFVLPLTPLLGLFATKLPRYSKRFVLGASICVGLAGSYLFFERLIG